MQGRIRAGALLVLMAGCTGEVTGSVDDVDASPETADAAMSADARPVPDAPAGMQDGAPDAEPGGTPGPLLGTYKLTYYYVTDEASYTGARDTAIYEPGCALLAMVTAAFSRSLAIEGTGRLDDGRVVNYTGSCGCPTSPCYRAVDAAHPWGSGAGGRALVPFRSVAVDRNVLMIGRKYYVEEFDGVQMPGDGTIGAFVHDGCVSADDTGGGIDGQHIDFFSALRGYYLTLDRQLGLANVTLREGGTKCR